MWGKDMCQVNVDKSLCMPFLEEEDDQLTKLFGLQLISWTVTYQRNSVLEYLPGVAFVVLRTCTSATLHPKPLNHTRFALNSKHSALIAKLELVNTYHCTLNPKP